MPLKYDKIDDFKKYIGDKIVLRILKRFQNKMVVYSPISLDSIASWMLSGRSCLCKNGISGRWCLCKNGNCDFFLSIYVGNLYQNYSKFSKLE